MKAVQKISDYFSVISQNARAVSICNDRNYILCNLLAFDMTNH